MIDPKSRMISIRLSDEEYRRVKSVCEVYGARSVSDFVRTAMNRLLKDGIRAAPGQHLEFRIEEVCARINILDRRVSELSSIVKGADASEACAGK